VGRRPRSLRKRRPPERATAVRDRLRAVSRGVPLAAVLCAAAALRLAGLGAGEPDPFYDAAVRSMGTSWHALLVGAFEPGARVAIDKPPVDLWLQVASTKLFGFTHFALLLPEALASTLAVVLLYDVVRRGFGRVAGLAAAAALAVLPIEVVTARSDTMDSFMIALLVLAAWLVVRAVESGRARELYLAAAVVGLAFTDEGDAIFDTVGSSRKARNLRRDPRASLVVWEGERTVQMEGRVDEPAGVQRDAIVKVYLAAFPDGVERLSWDGITHFRFRPSWVRDSDFGAGPEPRLVELPSGVGGS